MERPAPKELTGTVHAMAERDWNGRKFLTLVVAEQDGQYTNTIPFDVAEKASEIAARLQPGDKVRVRYSLGGKLAANGDRWFPHLRAYAVYPVEGEKRSANDDDSGIPF